MSQHLNRLGQIEDAVIGVGRDADLVGAVADLVIGQPVALAAEDQRHRALFGIGDRRAGHLVGLVEVRQWQAAQTRAGADHLHAIADRLLETGDDPSLLDHVGGTGGQPRRFRIGKAARVDQRQPGEAHGLHGTSAGADIAGVESLDEDDANIVEHAERLMAKPLSLRDDFGRHEYAAGAGCSTTQERVVQ